MRILLVDDERICLEDIETALAPTGYECVLESNPVRALERYQNERFDVVITDVCMPEMTGIELLQAIRAFDKHASVIIITGYGDLEMAIAAINHRALAFFGKPIDFEELIDLLQDIANKSAGDGDIHTDYLKLKDQYQNLQNAYSGLLSQLSKFSVSGNTKE